MRRVRAAMWLSLAWLVSGATAEELSGAEGNYFERLHDEGRLTLTASSGYYSSSRSLDDETSLLGTAFELRSRLQAAESLELLIDSRLHDSDLGKRGASTSVLREGYSTWRTGSLDLRLGRQIIAWGRADGLNPTDNLTPRDYTVLLPLEEEQRFGTTALTVDWAMTGAVTLEVFTTPYFQPSVVPLPPGAIYSQRLPAHTAADSELGVRLNRSGGDLDWSVSYFHGYSLTPDAAPVGFMNGVPVIALNYGAIDVLGGDLAMSIGQYGVRLEAAYTSTEDLSGSDPLVKNPYLYYVAGIDRTLGENLNINFQVLGIHVRSWSDPQMISDPVLRSVAVQNSIMDRQQQADTYGATLRIARRWLNDTLNTELLAVHYFEPSSSYLRPLVSYSLSDRLKLTLGGELYLGSPDSFFGLFRDNRGGFLEMRWTY